VPRRSLKVLVEPPGGRKSAYVRCADVDQCLEVVAREIDQTRNVTGTLVSIVEQRCDVEARVASWRIHGSGPRLQSYRPNMPGGHRVVSMVVDGSRPGWPGVRFYDLTAKTADGRVYRVDAIHYEEKNWADVFLIKGKGNLRRTGVTTKVGREIVRAGKAAVLSHHAEAKPSSDGADGYRENARMPALVKSVRKKLASLDPEPAEEFGVGGEVWSFLVDGGADAVRDLSP